MLGSDSKMTSQQLSSTRTTKHTKTHQNTRGHLPARAPAAAQCLMSVSLNRCDRAASRPLMSVSRIAATVLRLAETRPRVCVRLPNKHLFKAAYLDAVGEPAASPRRHATRGAEWAYTLNPGDSGREVAVVLLDGRYDRTPLPCSVRRD